MIGAAVAGRDRQQRFGDQVDAAQFTTTFIRTPTPQIKQGSPGNLGWGLLLFGNKKQSTGS